MSIRIDNIEAQIAELGEEQELIRQRIDTIESLAKEMVTLLKEMREAVAGDGS